MATVWSSTNKGSKFTLDEGGRRATATDPNAQNSLSGHIISSEGRSSGKVYYEIELPIVAQGFQGDYCTVYSGLTTAPFGNLEINYDLYSRSDGLGFYSGWIHQGNGNYEYQSGYERSDFDYGYFDRSGTLEQSIRIGFECDLDAGTIAMRTATGLASFVVPGYPNKTQVSPPSPMTGERFIWLSISGTTNSASARLFTQASDFAFTPSAGYQAWDTPPATTWDPSRLTSGASLSADKLTFISNGLSGVGVFATQRVPATGKVYFEITLDNLQAYSNVFLVPGGVSQEAAYFYLEAMDYDIIDLYFVGQVGGQPVYEAQRFTGTNLGINPVTVGILLDNTTMTLKFRVVGTVWPASYAFAFPANSELGVDSNVDVPQQIRGRFKEADFLGALPEGYQAWDAGGGSTPPANPTDALTALSIATGIPRTTLATIAQKHNLTAADLIGPRVVFGAPVNPFDIILSEATGFNFALQQAPTGRPALGLGTPVEPATSLIQALYQGTWRPGELLVKHNGVWKQATQMYRRQGGVWLPV